MQKWKHSTKRQAKKCAMTGGQQRLRLRLWLLQWLHWFQQYSPPSAVTLPLLAAAPGYIRLSGKRSLKWRTRDIWIDATRRDATLRGNRASLRCAGFAAASAQANCRLVPRCTNWPKCWTQFPLPPLLLLLLLLLPLCADNKEVIYFRCEHKIIVYRGQAKPQPSKTAAAEAEASPAATSTKTFHIREFTK